MSSPDPRPDQCPPSNGLSLTDEMAEVGRTNILCYTSSVTGDKEALQKCCNTTEEVFVTGVTGYDECHFTTACGQPKDRDDHHRITDLVTKCYNDAGFEYLACKGVEQYKGEEGGGATILRLSGFGGRLVFIAIAASVGTAL